VIVGASRPEQLDASVAAASTPLPDELVARLDEATAPESPIAVAP
jgi:aryl-alcohol dehydrogenase-like predicted oxidoreductase